MRDDNKKFSAPPAFDNEPEACDLLSALLPFTLSAELVGYGDAPWDKRGQPQTSHWKCRLGLGRKSTTIDFHMGSGHHGKAPSVSDLVMCLVNDAQAGDMSFDDYFSEFHSDPDEASSARRTWNACRKAGENMRRLLSLHPGAFEAASSMDNLEILSFASGLCEKDPSFLNPDPKNGRMAGLLHLAVWSSDASSAAAARSMGADPDARDASGKTAFDVAAIRVAGATRWGTDQAFECQGILEPFRQAMELQRLCESTPEAKPESI